MKELYKSPVISVEELEKADVLCASMENADIAISDISTFTFNVENLL